MPTVTIYRYKTRDIARRWGTRAAIAKLKEMAEILEATAVEVDEAVLSEGERI